MRCVSVCSSLALASLLGIGCSGGPMDDGVGAPPIPAEDSDPTWPSNDSQGDGTGGDPGGKEAPTTTDDPPDPSGDDSDSGEGSTGVAPGLGDTADEPDFGACVGLDPIGFVANVLAKDGGNPGGSCSATPDACGGDPVGEWTLESNCGQDNSPNIWAAFCPGSTRVVNSVENTGTLVLAPKSTFRQTTSSVRDETVTIDVAACWGGTCGELQSTLNAAEGVAASCAGSDEACTCDVTRIETTDISGIYQLGGDGELYLKAGNDVAVVSYCAAGDRLDLWAGQLQPTITAVPCLDNGDCEDSIGDSHVLAACSPEAPAASSASMPGPIPDLPWQPWG